MGSNLTEDGRKRAETKSAQRAEALRANLKRRKDSEAVKAAQGKNKGENDAKPENRE